ncbi:MAG: DUF1015 domain-containing protein [Acidobacteria bacterium]|nr:DUF1015 domain-containing protein [Acidobacteriota bacterium]
MAEIYPFRALHYNPAVVSDLHKVVTQPYDKISAPMRAAYYESSPFNFVRLILRKDVSGGAENIYSQSAQELRNWIDQRVLISDSEPAIYPYTQEYTVPGQPSERKLRWGFVALCRLEDYSAGVVHRHEATLSGPKVDRMELLKATRSDLGQIFLLYSDSQSSVEALLHEHTQGKPWQQATDENSTIHTMWRVSDPRIVAQVAESMAPRKLLIADGHHRYETALAYSKLRHDEAPEDDRANYVMATFVPLESDGLTILPTHRLVHSLEGFSWDWFCSSVKQFFAVEELNLSGSAAQDAQLIRESLDRAGRKQPTIAAYGGSKRLILLSLRQDIDLSRILTEVPETLRRLDLVLLHELVLEKVMSIDRQAVREQKHLHYKRDIEGSLNEVNDGRAQMAFLMNPTPIQTVCENAFAGQVLPQKSTDFYPKLLSGLTVYWMDNPAGL